MSLNKSDRNYIILILVVLISVLSMKVRPIKFRLVLKAINLVFLLVFLYKRDFKISLFLTLLLFSLNQNGIGNSVDFFQNMSKISGANESKCFIRCYEDETMTLEQCDTFCASPCKSECAAKLTRGTPIIQCNEMCDAVSSSNTEGFQNNSTEQSREDSEEEETTEETTQETTEPTTTTTQRQPLKSNERGCRIKCLDGDWPITYCKEHCKNACVNTCTESDRDFDGCTLMCS